jgi:hypothetical protein
MSSYITTPRTDINHIDEPTGYISTGLPAGIPTGYISAPVPAAVERAEGSYVATEQAIAA